jgi:hypothetical protein
MAFYEGGGYKAFGLASDDSRTTCSGVVDARASEPAMPADSNEFARAAELKDSLTEAKIDSSTLN